MKIHKLMPALVLIAIFNSRANAQAYCKLRDPYRGIQRAFPNAESHRSIVRSITKDVREGISNELPFTLHFNELGRHTLYVPTLGNRPLGLMHVRSEEGVWGMVEIAWSFDLELTVIDFEFQRCRSRFKSSLGKEAFRAQLRGKSFLELKALLSDDCESLKPNVLKYDDGAKDLVLTVVRSALKTISATKYGWKDDLSILNILNHAYAAFPKGHSVEQVTNLYTADVLADLERFLDSKESLGINRNSALMIRVLDKKKEVIGAAIRAEWQQGKQKMVLWWNVNPDLTIANVIIEGEWPNTEVESAFRKVRGLSFTVIQACSSTAELLSSEALIIVRALGLSLPAADRALAGRGK